MNSKQVKETNKKLVSFMQDVKDGDLRTILVNMQKMNDYMAEKLRIYEEHLASLTGKERPILTEGLSSCHDRTDMSYRRNPKMVFGSGGREI